MMAGTCRLQRCGALLLLLCVQAWSTEPSLCPAWQAMVVAQSSCPLFRNATANFEAISEAELAGQELATRAIRKALAKSFRDYDEAVVDMGVQDMVLGFPYTLDLLTTNPIAQRKVDGTGSGKPIFMHFSGPTGVGKSLCTDILARSMFSGVNTDHRRCGHLYFILTEHTAATPRDFVPIQQAINKTIVQQLKSCPRSLIVFDEIQNVPEDLLDSILEIFFGRQAITAGQAVMIMVSDLGHNKLEPGMTRPEATKAIQEAAKSNFLRVNKNGLLDNIVPFLPLGKEDLQHVAELELKKLQNTLLKLQRGIWAGRLTWSKKVTAWIAESCMEHGTCSADGGRGVQTYIRSEVMQLAEDQLAEECGYDSDKISYNNIDLRLYAPEGPLLAFIDTVFGDDEF